jgi:hypothetical protein
VSGVAALLRTRLACSHRGPINANTTRLARAVLRRGHAAGKRRDLQALSALDETLDRLHAGVPIGAERLLEDLLHAGTATDRLRVWLERQPRTSSDLPNFRIAAAVFGDGSVPKPARTVGTEVGPSQSSQSDSTSSSSK